MFWLNMFTAACALLVIVQWVMTLRAYRNIPLTLVERTVFNSLRTAKRSLLAVSILGVGASFVTALLPEYFSPWFFRVSLAIWLIPLSYACLPPSILLLGASRPEIKPLLRDLNRAIPLLRLTHLLDTAKVGRGRLLDVEVHQTTGRVFGGVSWEAIVYELVDTSPLIAVDTRIATPAVVEETILAFQYPYKSLFVVGTDGSSQVFALLLQKLGFIPSSIEVIEDTQVRSVVKDLLRGVKRPGDATAGSARLQDDFSRDPTRFDKYRDSFAPRAGPLLSYRDDLLRFSFLLPGGWAFGRKLDPAGCVLISKHGPLIVKATEAEDNLTVPSARKTELFNQLRWHGCADVTVVQDGRTFAGEENVVFYSYATPDGSRGFGISVVCNKVHYNIKAEGFPDPFLQDTVDALESSFRFATSERVSRLKELTNP